MSLVVLKGVQKTYRLDAVEVPSLVDIDVEIRANCFTVISGPSGSGKTTLLNIIGCIDQPDRGEVTVAGAAVSVASTAVNVGVAAGSAAVDVTTTVVKGAAKVGGAVVDTVVD